MTFGRTTRSRARGAAPDVPAAVGLAAPDDGVGAAPPNHQPMPPHSMPPGDPAAAAAAAGDLPPHQAHIYQPLQAGAVQVQHHQQHLHPLAALDGYQVGGAPPQDQHLASIGMHDQSAIPPVPHEHQQHQQHQHHQQQQGHPGGHQQDPPTPDSSPTSYTYANLTDGIVSHVFFPLVIKKIFEQFAQRSLPASHTAAHFDILEQRAMELKQFGELYGLEGACEKYASVDLFMSAMVTSLTGLKSRVENGSIDALLADTLAIASASVQGVTPGIHASSGPDGASFGDSLLAPLAARSPGLHAGAGVTKPFHAVDPSSMAPRRKLKPQARRCLEDWFESHLESPYPTDAEKQALAAQCQLEVHQARGTVASVRVRSALRVGVRTR
jgi:hypothetical protein